MPYSSTPQFLASLRYLGQSNFQYSSLFTQIFIIFHGRKTWGICWKNADQIQLNLLGHFFPKRDCNFSIENTQQPVEC